MKEWCITQMNSKPKDGNLTDFVVEVFWVRNANEIINNQQYNASIIGKQSFSADNVTDFIPYDQLTYDIVCGWLNDSIDVTALDADLDIKIQQQASPTIVTLPLPFTNP